MKQRNDFVSNSSSCSFIISTNKNYDKKQLIKDISKNCKCDWFDNKIVLNNVWTDNIMSFCGDLVTDYTERIIDSSDKELYTDKLTEFEYVKQNLENSEDSRWLSFFYSFIDDKHDKILYRAPNIVSARKITFGNLSDILHEKDDKEFFKRITDKKYDTPFQSSCVINDLTIQCTERLIKMGYEIRPFNQILTCDKIKDMIKQGDQIYMIHVNYSGDGTDDDCIRSEREYPSDIFNDLNVEILNSETF